MKISEIDKNLKVETRIRKDDIVWFSPRTAPFRIHGLVEAEKDMPYHRLPESVAAATSRGVHSLMWHTAGGRVRFAANSPYIAIKIVMTNASETMPHITKTGQSGCDLYAYNDGEHRYIGSFIPPSGPACGYESLIPVGIDMRTYTINMPLYDCVSELYVGLARGAELEEPRPYGNPVPVVYYGSSITQGGCASRPGNAYLSMIERQLDTDYINLGFSGSAKGEKPIAEYLASLQASVFVCDYDHNASLDGLKQTHLPLYRTYREKNPDTPIIFVSKPDFRGGEDTERRAVIRNTYQTAREEGDKNVYFIDGEGLFAGELRDSCTVDGCHPNDLGFFRMAQVIGKEIRKVLKI